MPIYALKVVPGTWDIEQPLPFSEEQYQRHQNQVEPGMRVVIYQADPVNGVVAEGEVHLTFIHSNEWTGTLSVHPQEKPATHLLPVRILYRRAGPAAVMPLEEVREILDDPTFPRPDQDWLVLKVEQYQELIDGWT